MRIRPALGLGLIIIGANSAFAQVPVGETLDEYLRLMQLTGAVPSTSVTVRPSLSIEPLLNPGTGRSNPWDAVIKGRRATHDSLLGVAVTLAPLSLDLAWNSDRPWGVNDGAVWQGRGRTVAIGGGAAFRRGRWSAAIRPQVIRTGNADFALSPLAGNAGLSPFAYPSGIGQTLDMPQRFGPEPFTTFDLGQSYVRGEFGPVAVGLSNENMWWGPGRRNAISMTNNAPGFGHVFLGTARPANIGIGTLSTRWVWGRLRESRYFDADAANDSRFMTGIAVSFMPEGAEGLELGATRTFLHKWRDGGPTLSQALGVFIPLSKKSFITPENPAGNDDADQMASLFVRWASVAAGFEVYAEWGRGDHSWDLRDITIEPEHASAWILGFQKAIDPSSKRLWRVAGELTLLGAGRTSSLRAPASAFYVHHLVRQGYTQRGQVMGAGIGPGSSQAFLGVDRVATWGRVGVGALRTVYDNNRFYAGSPLYYTHEVEPSLMADVLVFQGAWDLLGAVTVSRLLNKHYIDHNDETNVNMMLGARFHFGAR